MRVSAHTLCLSTCLLFVYVCMCERVCVDVCLCVVNACVCLHVDTCLQLRTQARVSACAHVRACMCLYASACKWLPVLLKCA
jgi:hypothetical protein